MNGNGLHEVAHRQGNHKLQFIRPSWKQLQLPGRSALPSHAVRARQGARRAFWQPPLLAVGLLLLLAGCSWTIRRPPAPAEPLVPTPVGARCRHGDAWASSVTRLDAAGHGAAASGRGRHAALARRRRRAGRAEPLDLRVDGAAAGLVSQLVGGLHGDRLDHGIAVPNLGSDVEIPFHIPPDEEAGMEFAPMVRMKQGELEPPLEWIAATAAARPGHTWLIGNEPDVRWQDNTTPEAYAEAYHDAYHAIKQADPTAQVADRRAEPDHAAAPGLPGPRVGALRGHVRRGDARGCVEHARVRVAGEGGRLGRGYAARLRRHDDRRGVSWTIEQHDDLALVEEQVRAMRALDGRAWTGRQAAVDQRVRHPHARRIRLRRGAGAPLPAGQL